jgi:hypothetical protein
MYLYVIDLTQIPLCGLVNNVTYMISEQRRNWEPVNETGLRILE